MKTFRMAWRNVWRNKRRSLVTMAAMTLALGTLTVYGGLIQGYMLSMEANIVEIEVGDLQVHAEGYRDKPSLYTRIDSADELIRKYEEAGYPATARLLATGLAAGGESSSGAVIRGVDPVRDTRVSEVHAQVHEGTWLDPNVSTGVVIGRKLAKTLGVSVGDELLVLTQGADGSMANEVYEVRGVLRGISEATDRAGVFMSAAAYRDLMVVPDGVHQIIVRRPPGVTLEAASAEVGAMTKDDEVKTWRQLMPTFAQLLDTQKGMIWVMYVILYVAVGIVLLNAMLMAVYERIREFGVLKAIGMGPGQVFRLILAESSLQMLIAMAAGLALAYPWLLYLEQEGINMGAMAGVDIMGIAMDPIWKAQVNAETFRLPLVTFLVVLYIATIIPAVRAARLRPIDAMRHQ